jgi:hypothetical protein
LDRKDGGCGIVEVDFRAHRTGEAG